MAPEYGATIAFFPVDAMTLDYLRLTGRAEARVALVEAYTKEQGLFRTDHDAGADLRHGARARSRRRRAVPRRSGRPQDRVVAEATPSGVRGRARPTMQAALKKGAAKPAAAATAVADGAAASGPIRSITAPSSIAAITSCTNTSNPSVMIGAGLLAKKAVERGLTSKPWVKTSARARLAGRHRLSRGGRA